MIIFSDDWRGPGFGFLTKARGYDKLAHAGGSALLMLLLLWIVRLIAGPLIMATIGLWLATIITALAGLGVELYQGGQLYSWTHGPSGDLGARPQTDGFSWLDLVADAIGIMLVWAVVS